MDDSSNSESASLTKRTEMNTPTLLLFDLGGVLIEIAIFESLSRLLPAPVDTDTLKNR